MLRATSDRAMGIYLDVMVGIIVILGTVLIVLAFTRP